MRRLVLLTLLAVPLAFPDTSTAGTSPPAGTPEARLDLVGQTPWVGTGGDFDVRLRVEGGPDPSELEVVVQIHPAVANRSEFELTLDDRLIGSPVASLPPVPLRGLVRDADGAVTVRTSLQDPQAARDPRRVSLGRRDGVYPVRVELRRLGAGPVVDQLTTHLVYLPSEPGTRLGVSLVLPVHAPPSVAPGGSRRLPALDDLVSLARAADGARDVPFTLAPTAETLDALAASPDERAAAALASLRRASTDRQVVGGPYVPVSVPALVASGLDDELARQVADGASALSTTLRATPDRRTWLSREPVDPASLSRVRALGFDRVIVPQGGLGLAPSQKLTLTRPYLVDAREGRRQVVATVDGSLASHFDRGPGPVLSAHHLLADLAVVYLDQPGSGPRAVVAVPPASWKPDRRFLDAALRGLARSPILEPLSLEALFSTVSPVRFDLPAPARRASPRGTGLNEVASELRAARRRVDSLSSVMAPDDPVQADLRARLLVAQSAEIRSARQREAYVSGVQRGIDAELRKIQMPRGSITLTDRRGEIPVTFQNATGRPVRVVVEVESDKLSFPRGARLSLTLARRNTTERFSVVARTSGTFPIRVTLRSPDGRLVIGQTRLTVRSTATSRVGVGVSVAAAAFLAVWWVRRLLGSRRAHRLVPA